MSLRERLSHTEFWWSAIWIVFLVVPVMLVRALSVAGPVWDAIAYLGIGGFAAMTVIASPTERQTLTEWSRMVWQWLGLLVCIALTLPSLRSGATAFIPYLFSAIAFRSGAGATLVSFGAGLVLIVIAPILAGVGEGSVGWAIGGPLISHVFILVIWVLHMRSEVEERARSELAAVEEREAISRDVHDVLGHTLTIVSLKAQLARRTLRADPEQAEAELDDLLRLTDTALADVRATVGRLRIPDLAAQIEAAREALSAAEIRVWARGSYVSLSPSQRALAAWFVREATTNVLRHADAREVEIDFGPHAVTIIDDGVGIQAAEGFGLTGLRRRVEEAGGTLTVSPSFPERERPGTRLQLEFA